MKPLLMLIALVVSLGLLPARSYAQEREEQPRTKGVELYSWQDERGDWLFVLLDGTNRVKQEAEIKGAKELLRGAESLHKALARLAVGEQVFWTHHVAGFEFPPVEQRKKVITAAREARIELHVGRED
jgi:hypothetical protein